MKSRFQEKNMVLCIEKLPSVLIQRNAIMLQHLIIPFLLLYLSSGHLQEVKNKLRKFQTLRFKSSHSCLGEVVPFKGSKYSDLT